tara:strand:- start:2227 stop:3000 length:774 start_codon:yes stop_codon:yes gene_type:complete
MLVSLADYISEKRKTKDILIMAHVVCGFPSFEDNMKALDIMQSKGVDLVELQFPFSEPSADGPLFVQANEESLKSGTTVDQCFDFMKEVTSLFSFKVLMMGYYNTVFKMGEEEFLRRLANAGGAGFILPDLPLEEAVNLNSVAIAEDLAPIVLMTPTSSDQRLAKLGAASYGMVYVIARKGVTGSKTIIGDSVLKLVERCRKHTDVPIAVGFGISGREDVDALSGHADVAVVGSAALRAWKQSGASGLHDLFSSLSR